MNKQRLHRWLIGLCLSVSGLGWGYWYGSGFVAYPTKLWAADPVGNQNQIPQPDAGATKANPAATSGLNFQVESYDSQVFGQSRSYGVVLPPNYASQPERRYPVVFLLHGGHGSPRDWQDKGSLLSVLQSLYSQNRLIPTIIITPDGNDKRGSSPFFDPQYYDGPNGQVATAIAVELAQVVKSRYRTLTQPQFWAMGGLSSGGWGALNIGLHHLEQFQTLFSHSGYFTDHSGLGNSPDQFIRSLPQGTLKGLHVYLDAGEEDGKYLKSTQAFQQTLSDLGVSHQTNVFPGGHGIMGPNSGWNYWRQHLADSLSYVGQQFQTSLSVASKPTTKPQ